MKKQLVGALLFAALVCVPLPATAGLIGHEVIGCATTRSDSGYPCPAPAAYNDFLPGPVTVGAGVEFQTRSNFVGLAADLSGDTLRISYKPGYYWVIGVDFEFTDLTPGAAFSGISLLSNTIAYSTNPGTQPVELTYSVTGNTIHVFVPSHLTYEGFDQAAEFRLASVPDPGSTAVLLALGLLSLAACRRRQR